MVPAMSAARGAPWAHTPGCRGAATGRQATGSALAAQTPRAGPTPPLRFAAAVSARRICSCTHPTPGGP